MAREAASRCSRPRVARRRETIPSRHRAGRAPAASRTSIFLFFAISHFFLVPPNSLSPGARLIPANFVKRDEILSSRGSSGRVTNRDPLGDRESSSTFGEKKNKNEKKNKFTPIVVDWSGRFRLFLLCETRRGETLAPSSTTSSRLERVSDNSGEIINEFIKNQRSDDISAISRLRLVGWSGELKGLSASSSSDNLLIELVTYRPSLPVVRSIHHKFFGRQPEAQSNRTINVRERGA